MMNLNAACNLLDVNAGCDISDVERAFKRMAVKHHPDRNKGNEEASEKIFKKVNEAYQYLKKNGTKERRVDSGFNGFQYGFNINDFFRQESVTYNGEIRISFEESVKGCSKSISVNTNDSCGKCSGLGKILESTKSNCLKCDATGKKKVFGRDMDCPHCSGTSQCKNTVQCSDCNGTGTGGTKLTKVSINIPAGISSGSIIQIPVNGQKFKYRVMVDNISKVFERDGLNVISALELSLLDAVKGCSRKVNTCYGENTLKINPGVKHKEIVKVKGYGVARRGDHLFVVSVKYPKDTSKLISCLEDIYEEKD